jgi:hypothetical protein
LATLEALATSLTHYGSAGGAPDWLITGAWLRAANIDYFVTANVEVLSDGFVARSLSIARPEEVAHHLESDLPDVAARLAARGNGTLPPSVELPAPGSLQTWTPETYDMRVLVRVTRRASSTHRIACGLLFTGADGGALLVGSDPSTLALVMCDEGEMIERYQLDCVALTLSAYRAGG